MFDHILVPLDGSLLAERAITHAELFAQVFGGKITLLQVLDPSPHGEDSNGVEPLNWQIRKAEAEMYLQGIASKIQENGITAGYALREGRTPENIIDFAHQENVDLVVLSTHGASGLSRWNTSSVTAKILEKIYLPLLLVRAFQETGSVPVSGESKALNPPLKLQTNDDKSVGTLHEVGSPTENQRIYTPYFYRRILLPIDTSRRAECSLSAVTGLAQGEKGEEVSVILGAVLDPPDLPIPAPYPEEINQLIERFTQISRTAIENYLHDLSQRLQFPCKMRIVENDNISSALHLLADQENVDLVVLCAHGRTGGINWPYGSVTRNYLEHGTRTVLVVQDVPRQQVRQTMAEIAAEKFGRR